MKLISFRESHAKNTNNKFLGLENCRYRQLLKKNVRNIISGYQQLKKLF